MNAVLLRKVAVMLCLATALAACDAWKSPEARMALAESAAANGDSAGAVAQLRQVLSKQPENAKARLMLARHLVVLGDVQASVRILDGGRPTDDLRAQWAALRCEVGLQVGQYAELLTRIDEGRSDLQGVDRMVCRGRTLIGLRRTGAAEEEFKGALAQDSGNAAAATGLAEALALQGRADEGLAVLEPILARDPDSFDARLVQATIFMQRGRYRDAQVAVASGGEPAAGVSAFQRARRAMLLVDAHLAQGNVDDAAKAQQALAQVAPGSIATRLAGARVALARGDYLNGTADLQRIVTGAPQLLQARMLLAVAHFSQGNYRQAERHLEQVLQAAPDNVEARKMLARVQLQIDQPQAALRTLSAALEGDAFDSQMYSLLGISHLRTGESDRAVEVLEKALRENPDDLGVRRELAYVYLTMGRNAQALTLLRALPSEPSNVGREALLLRAIHAERGPNAAAMELEKLLREQPQNSLLLLLAAEFYASRNEFERARAALNVRLKANPNDYAAMVTLARVELASGNRSAAEGVLKQAIAAEASRPEPRLALAQLYLASADATRARAAIDEAVAVGQGRAEVVNAAGLVLLNAQRFDESLALFRRATDLDPDQPGYWLNMARAQAALNNPNGARESAQRALDLRPDSIGAQTLLTWLDLRTTSADAAVARARSLSERWPHSPAPKVLEGDVHMSQRHYDDAVAAYRDAERLGGDASLAVKLFNAIRLANRDRPEESLERWLGQHPQDLQVRGVLATYFDRTNRPARAAAELEAMLQARPNDPVLLNNLAWQYHTLSDPRAEESAARAHSLLPTHPAIADTYGWILLSRKKVGQAVQVLSVAAQAAPTDASIQYHYAAALAAAGRAGEARDLLTKALRSQAQFDERRNAENLLAKLSR